MDGSQDVGGLNGPFKPIRGAKDLDDCEAQLARLFKQYCYDPFYLGNSS